ncbi:MAG: DUF433 domain-containing protein [Chloroflexota bacterium]|nr:DUF433 domain-containing protein [Chloroflexota bacterium]
MTLELATQPVPLHKNAQGVLRVGNTRVSLDVVITNYRQGLTAEAIVQELPTLDLGDVYAVLAYYLHHQAEVSAYLAEEERYADELQRQWEADQPLTARRALVEGAQ